MKKRLNSVTFIPTELSIDEIIDSDIYFGQNFLKEVLKVIRVNQGSVNSELLEIFQLLQIGEITSSKQKLINLNSDYISSDEKNTLITKINLHLGIE